MKQKIQGKNYAVFHFAGFLFVIFFVLPPKAPATGCELLRISAVGQQRDPAALGVSRWRRSRIPLLFFSSPHAHDAAPRLVIVGYFSLLNFSKFPTAQFGS
jgi:hypothetical protein